jgi:hypothetical protein
MPERDRKNGIYAHIKRNASVCREHNGGFEMWEKVITTTPMHPVPALTMAKDGSTKKVFWWGCKINSLPVTPTTVIWNCRWGVSGKMVLSSGLAPTDKEL